jgi:drug/metabolite transporter (DMT)-like permease
VLDPFFLGSLRYSIGVFIFIAILRIAEGREALRYGGRFMPAMLFGVVGFCGFNVLVWWGLAFTRPEHASIILALQTPMTALAVWITRGLRPRPFTVGCIAVAIGGVLVVVTKGHFSGWSPLRMTVLTCIPGTIGLVAINAISIALGYSTLPSLEAVWSVKWQLAYFVVFTVVLGVLGFNNGVKYLGALNAMLMLNLIPIIVFSIEAWLGRSFAPVEIGGAALVIVALVANNFYLRKQSTVARA